MDLSAREKKLKKIATGILFGILAGLLLLLGSLYRPFFFFLFLLLALLGLAEFLKMFQLKRAHFAYPLLALLLCVELVGGSTLPFLFVLFLLFPFLGGGGERGASLLPGRAGSAHTQTGSLAQGSLVLFGVVYMSLFFFPVHLVFSEQGVAKLALALVLTWGSDVAAYFAGSLFGRRKLAENLSPHKTVEGAVGGLFGGLLVAFLFQGIARAFNFSIGSLPTLLLLGLGSSGAAQTGDLFESYCKRQAGVKDASSLFPEHGGILDRLDSFLFVALFLDLWFRLGIFSHS